MAEVGGLGYDVTETLLQIWYDAASGDQLQKGQGWKGSGQQSSSAALFFLLCI